MNQIGTDADLGWPAGRAANFRNKAKLGFVLKLIVAEISEQ
jgi:hypothetical protein